MCGKRSRWEREEGINENALTHTNGEEYLTAERKCVKLHPTFS